MIQFQRNWRVSPRGLGVSVSPRKGLVFPLELPLTVGCFTWSYDYSSAKALAFLIAT